jgi:uncharacterized protein YjbJ (UPF0337 family)
MRDQVKGKIEEMHGKITGDKTEEVKGKARQKVGDLKARVRDAREDVRQAAAKDRGH